MTLASKLLEDISKAIFDKGAGDIDPRRLANISLGELIPFLEKNGITLTIGGQMSIDEMVSAIVEQHKPEGMKHVHGVTIVVEGCDEEKTLDPFDISPQDIMKMNEQEAEEFFNLFPASVMNHPLMIAKMKDLIRLNEFAQTISGRSVPRYPVLEVLKRRFG